MNETIEYYNNNAESFVSGTKDIRFTQIQERFMSRIHDGGTILDFGCGSGRDTKYFMEHGFAVDAIDGSEKLCKIASEYTDISVRHMYFQELDEHEKYDGIWACSSILHLPKDELGKVFELMIRAAKNGGFIYTSFKYGEFEGCRGDRYFTDFTEESFGEFLKDYSSLEVVEMWVSPDVRPGRGEEKWLNMILHKKVLT